MKLSIIIPAYNEEATIQELLQKVIDAPLSIDKEIIIVDDGSTDNTLRMIREFASDLPESLMTWNTYKPNRGKGYAVRKGIEMATGDIVIIQDADLEYDPNDYQSLIDPILSGKAEVVYGSRYSSIKNGTSSFSFFFGGRMLNLATRFFYPNFPTSDEPTCYKVFKRELLDGIKLESNGFEICPELTATFANKGVKYVDVPIHYYPRTIKEGKKIKWSDGLIAVKVLARYSKIWNQIFKFALVGAIGAVFHLSLLWFFTEIVKVHYLLSALIGISGASAWTFVLNRLWTFRESS